MPSSPLRALPSALVASLLLGIGAVSVAAQQACNGYSDFCSRPYSNITYIGAHDSYAVDPTGENVAANQHFDVTTQLDNGIRMLQAQGHNQNGAIHFCHTNCILLDAGPVTDYLNKVKSWLDNNPNEVITLLFVNSDDLPCTTWADAFQTSQLSSLLYNPPSTPVAKDAWPTLQDMISSGKRVVAFLDNGADTSNSQCAGILDEFTQMWETPFDETDNTFPCTQDRINQQANPTMYTMNHFLDVNTSSIIGTFPVPDMQNINTTNAATGPSSIGTNAESCAAQHGSYPTFVLVDFYDMGNGSVFEAAANLNGVPYHPVTIGNGSSDGDSGSGSMHGISLPWSTSSVALVVGAALLGGIMSW